MSRVRIQAGPREVRRLRPSAAELWRGAEPPGHQMVSLDLSRGAVLLVERGRAGLRGPGVRAALGPGDACVVPPGEAVVLEVARGPALSHRLLRRPEGAVSTPRTLVVRDEELRRALLALDEAPLPPLDLIEERLGRVARGAAHGSRRSGAVRRAVHAIVSNLPHAASTEELARAAGVSKYHLAHRFKDELGLSPHAYRICARVCRARQLLRRGQPLAGVAAQCGFADQSHLHHWFGRVLGLTPGRYAAAWREALGRAP